MQHLRIGFYGPLQNAVKTQIWIAGLVVAIVKKHLNLEASLYTLLQILPVILFDKMPIESALSRRWGTIDDGMFANQLNLFAYYPDSHAENND